MRALAPSSTIGRCKQARLRREQVEDLVVAQGRARRSGRNSGSSVRTIASAGPPSLRRRLASVAFDGGVVEVVDDFEIDAALRAAARAWRATCCNADCGRFWPSSVRSVR